MSGNSGHLSGHALRDGGAAFKQSTYAGGPLVRVSDRIAGGPGLALCKCGTASPVLPSIRKRLAWYDRHRNEARADRAVPNVMLSTNVAVQGRVDEAALAAAPDAFVPVEWTDGQGVTQCRRRLLVEVAA